MRVLHLKMADNNNMNNVTEAWYTRVGNLYLIDIMGKNALNEAISICFSLQLY